MSRVPCDVECSVGEEIFCPVEEPCGESCVLQLVDYALVGGFVESLFEVKHDENRSSLFVETFCDMLIESGYVVLAAFLLSKAGLAWR